MRLNLEQNPSIFVANSTEMKRITSVASNKKKTFLSEKDYNKSVESAKKAFNNLAFELSRWQSRAVHTMHI